MSKWSKLRDALEAAADHANPVATNPANLLWAAANAAGDRLNAPIPDEKVVGDAILAALKSAGSEVLNSNHPKEWAGDLRGLNAQYGVGALPAGLLDAIAPLSPTDRASSYAEIRKIREEGGSGRDIWEATQGQKGGIDRLAADLAVDPTTYLALGAGGVGKKLTAEGAARIAAGGAKNQLTGTAIRGTGQVITGADMAVNRLPDKVVDKMASEVIGRAARSKPGQYLTGLSPREAVRRDLDQLFPLYKTIRNREMTNKMDQGYQAARALPGVGVPDIFDPGRIANNAWNKLTSPLKNKLVTEQDVGSQVFERGEHAGKSMMDVVQHTWDRLQEDRDYIQQLGVSWEDAANKDKIKASLNKMVRKGNLTPGERNAFLDKLDHWNELGVDPLNDPQGSFAALLKGEIAKDPTMASLSDEENALIFDRAFKVGRHKGETYIQALKKIEQEFIEDRKKLWDKVGVNAWPQRAPMDLREEVVKGTGAQKIFEKWRAEGVDLMHDAPEESTFQMFSRYVYGDAGVETNRHRSKLAALANIWKGTALLSPRYHAANITGNYFNTIITNGLEGLPTPPEYIQQIRHTLQDDPNVYDTFALSTINDTLEDHGLARVNRNIAHAGMASLESGVQESTERIFRRFIGQDAARAFGKVLEGNRRIAAGVDAAARGKLWETKFKSEYELGVPDLLAKVREMADKEGLTLAPDISLLPFRDPEKLLGYYRGLGFRDGNARRLARNAAELNNKADKAGMSIVHKAMFSYYRSRTDEALSKVIPFHYYASRSTALYFEEMARNPVVALNMARLSEELFRDYQDSGLSARQKGWLYVMSGPGGFSLLMNPDALLGFTRAMGLMGDNYDSDETQLGGILKWMKAGGYGMYPWVDGLFNMFGAYGDTFEPDMLGIRHRALVGALVNSVAAEFGLGEPGMQAAPYAELNAKAREHISTWASAVLPGWMSQPVQAKANDSGTIAEASMEKLIESRVIHNNPGLTNQQLFDIMNDPDNDAHRQAWEEVTRAGVTNQLLSFILPVGLKLRDNDTDVRGAVLGTTYEWADKLGIAPSDVTPGRDAEFAAAYAARTGKAWSPGDFDQARLEQMLTTATPQARPFLIKLEQQRALGSAAGRQAITHYNAIKYGDLVPSGFGGPPATIDEGELRANQWLASQPRATQAAYQEARVLRADFEQKNPEFGQFKAWQGQMYTLQNLLGGDLALYRENLAKSNPNAAKYFEDQKNRLLKRKLDLPAFREAMNQATTSPDAWLAITGVARAQAQQAPLPTSANVPYDPAAPMVDDWRGRQPEQNQAAQSPWGSFLQSFG